MLGGRNPLVHRAQILLDLPQSPDHAARVLVAEELLMDAVAARLHGASSFI
jgi:hypothetical protein